VKPLWEWLQLLLLLLLPLLLLLLASTDEVLSMCCTHADISGKS
jgi:hypothetical protein